MLVIVVAGLYKCARYYVGIYVFVICPSKTVESFTVRYSRFYMHFLPGSLYNNSMLWTYAATKLGTWSYWWFTHPAYRGVVTKFEKHNFCCRGKFAILNCPSIMVGVDEQPIFLRFAFLTTYHAAQRLVDLGCLGYTVYQCFLSRMKYQKTRTSIFVWWHIITNEKTGVLRPVCVVKSELFAITEHCTANFLVLFFQMWPNFLETILWIYMSIF